MSLYEMPVTALKGFGKTRGQLFSKLSVNSVGDLVRFYPPYFKNKQTAAKKLPPPKKLFYT